MPTDEAFDWLTSLLGRIFGFKRAILKASCPINNGTQLHLLNIHACACPRTDDILPKQIAIAHELMRAIPDGDAAVLAGDFNTELDPDKKTATSLLPLANDYEVFPKKLNPEKIYDQTEPTFQPSYSQQRCHLDHMFFNKVNLNSATVIANAETKKLSDHLPVVASIGL